jgi:hypothetical protein
MNGRLALVVALTLAVAGCEANGTPTGPTTTSSPASPAGSWSGSITDGILGDGSMQLTLRGSESSSTNSLVGTWAATFKNGESFSGGALADLYLPRGYGIMLYVLPPPPYATGPGGPGTSALLSFTLINVVVTSSQLTAVSGRLSCSGTNFGTVNLSKQ